MTQLNNLSVQSPLIVALDVANREQALALVEQLSPELCRLKVGKELFTRTGPILLKDLVTRGFEVFLDLKFHDIPNTVAAACRAAADMGVWMINVHALGGKRMLTAARAALEDTPRRPLLIAVTVLTSMAQEDLEQVGIANTPQQQVLRLAGLAQSCGLDGVVCSAQEASLVRGNLGRNFCLVTPGIRPHSAAHHDQRRVMTPREAMQAGVDYLVIGRPITQAPQPLQALQAVLDELACGDNLPDGYQNLAC